MGRFMRGKKIYAQFDNINARLKRLHHPLRWDAIIDGYGQTRSMA